MPAPAGRILIVRPSALGDVCRTVPVLVALRNAHPDAHIDWLVRAEFADSVRHHPALNGVIPFDRRSRSPLRAFAFARQLRRQRYDLVVDMQGLFRSGLFTRLTGAPTRLGFANAREMGWLGYNRSFAVDPAMHTVDRMLGLLRAAGYEPTADLRLYAAEADRRWRAEQFSQPYVCLAPTAQWLCKCWPIERYVELARRLMSAGRRVVVLAAPNERNRVQPLLDLNLPCPKTTVGQLMALIEAADLLVCNDSAPLHMAVGFNRPVVALFGPTDPGLVGPYKRSDAVIQPEDLKPADIVRYRARKDDQSLIARIAVETVWRRIS